MPAPATTRDGVAPRKGRLTLVGIAGVVLGGAGVVLVVRALVRERDAVGDTLAGGQLVWIAGGVLAAAAGMVAIAVPWALGLRLLGAPVRGWRHVPWYFVGEIGKYLPGGVWPVLGRGEMARRRGVGPAAAYGSVALSLVALYLAAMAAAVVLLPFRFADGAGTTWWLAAAVLLPVGLLALHPRPVALGVRVVERLAGREFPVVVPGWAASLRYVASYLPAWALIAVATWGLARALASDAAPGAIAFATVVSWLAGFLAVPVPGGIGVREAVFVAAAGLSPGVAAAVALLARAVFMGVDVAGAILATVWVARRDRVGGPSTTLPGGESDMERAPGRRRGR